MSPNPELPGLRSSRGLSPEAIRVIVRVVLFVALVVAGMMGFQVLFRNILGAAAPILISATMATFGSGVLANAVLARMYEEGRLSTVGLGWSPSSGRELLGGILSGACAAGLILAVALTLRVAYFEAIPDTPGSVSGWLFATVLLLFGAFGEELMFHGYAFQLLTRTAGDFAALLPVGVLFGIAHMGNDNVTFLGVINTVTWGILLGYAFLRTRALWLPIGLHFGWNAALPLIGVNLSGFTIGVTGYDLRWRVGTIWSGGDYGVEGGLFTTMIVILLFFAVQRLTRQEVLPE